MSQKAFLLWMSLIAVISDSMLHPFYPQYFAKVLGVHDARHVGTYIAACSFTVLATFPAWALAARKISVLPLLIGTQIATAILSLLCSATSSLIWFWILSLCAMVFKASYLLIYPYLMSLEEKEQHLGTVSLLAFVAYSGNTLAALLSGLVFQLVDARFLFVVMACGDLLQIALCIWMLKRQVLAVVASDEPAAESPEPVSTRFVYRLGAVMFILYFSAYLSEPFFSSFWESISGLDNKILSGFVFAMPGMAALLGLFINANTKHPTSAYAGILPAIVLAAGCLTLQLTGQQTAVLVGRFAYGWALFQSMVRLDLLLFRLASPETYAVDFSKINTFQGLGVLFASFGAGAFVSAIGMQATFAIAAAGFMAGAFLFCVLFRHELWPRASVPRTEQERLVT